MADLIFRLPGTRRPHLLAIALVLAGGSWARGQVTLQWKLPTDSRFRVECRQLTTTQTRVQRQDPTRTTMDLTMTMTWNAGAGEQPGTIRLRQIFDRFYLKLTMRRPNRSVAEVLEYDSQAAEQSPATEPFAKSLGALVGSEFLVEIDRQGNVLKVVPPADLPETVQQGFSPGRVEQILQQALVLLPAEPVQPQASWTAQRTAETPLGKAALKDRYTLAELESRGGRELAKITVATDLELPAENREKLQQFQQSAEFWFDPQAGHLAESHSRQQLKSATTLRGQVVAVDLESKVEVTFRKLADNAARP